jgi:hypothetical protein
MIGIAESERRRRFNKGSTLADYIACSSGG